MSLICQSHTKVDSIIISILDNKYLLLAPPSGRILRKKGKREWLPFFPSHWRNSKKKSPCGPSRPAGTCKGTGAASILPCKKQEPSEMVRIRLTFAAGILTGAKKRPRRGRISGCLRSRWPARSTVCRGKNTSRRSGDFSGDAEHR